MSNYFDVTFKNLLKGGIGGTPIGGGYSAILGQANNLLSNSLLQNLLGNTQMPQQRQSSYQQPNLAGFTAPSNDPLDYENEWQWKNRNRNGVMY